MNMVGHHHPGVQRVAMRVEVPERIRHQARHVRMAEVAIARAMVKEGFERFLFGDTRRTRSGRPGGSRGYTNYSQFSSGRKTETRREMSPRARANHDFDDIVLQTRTEAETVLDRMIDLMDQFDVVAVSDLMGLVGITPNYTDEKWGWYSLKGASVSRIRDGYLLDLPPTEPID